MFDNLKKKLGSFREDAEEAAEENVEEVDEDELELDAEEEPLEDDRPETDAEDAASEAPDTTGKTADSDDVAESESELEAEAAPPAETADASAGSKAVSPVDETDAEEASTAPDGPATAESPSASETAASEVGDAADLEAEAEPDEALEDDEDDSDDADNGGSTGFGAKARSLVKGKFVIEEEDLEGPLHELEMALLSSDVEMGVAEEILDNIRDDLIGETRTFTTSTGEVVEEALRDAIYDVISVGQFDFDERIAVEDKPLTIVFTGVNGVGKTTSIAKLSRYFEERGYSTVMANGDTYRAGANEQIQEHADALDTKLITHQQGGDPAAVLYDAVEYAEANDVDIVLGDTAGRLHTDEGLMDQLEKIDRVVGPDMTLFVDEAVAGQDAVNRGREFNEAAEIDGAILTKADADSNGGAAISVAHVTGKPILFLGVGQGYDDLEPFDPEEMVDRLLEDES
ncbi:signal recognition particle-docking protein FtsY [Natronorubrum sp. JWXQ-INN-674]|uniref:Signal recognition particle receptor FtsY n=1 Tax=Natronorubrum halalkaliphilum TaxID=2691917 RepID=A0A6B0VNY7_9EURY|nr:signal recognition particle-docking protein FtsY [Natronorubrum halalkaliphilum]MXV62873.1 signal recognition particle-docking protein FtsY [Natronorubrum halalkaliphilum]